MATLYKFILKATVEVYGEWSYTQNEHALYRTEVHSIILFSDLMFYNLAALCMSVFS